MGHLMRTCHIWIKFTLQHFTNFFISQQQFCLLLPLILFYMYLCSCNIFHKYSGLKVKVCWHILKIREGFMNECRFYVKIFKISSSLCCRIITVTIIVHCDLEFFPLLNPEQFCMFNPQATNVTHTHTHTHIYIYIYIYIYMGHPFVMFLDHTQRRTTVGRTPLDE